MTVYAVNKFCRRVVHEADLRDALATDPERALRSAMPALDENEVHALMRGDVGWLSRHGCNNFMLHNLARFRMLGLDLEIYASRIRDEYRAERDLWKQTGDWPNSYPTAAIGSTSA